MSGTTRTKASTEEFIHTAAENGRYIMCPEEARKVIETIGTKGAALDFETTGLDPRFSRVRLSCIYSPETGAVVLDHDYCGKFNDMAHLYKDAIWYVYNAKFEYRWFDHAKAQSTTLVDVDFTAKVKRGGGHSSLKVMAKRDLFYDMDKQEQLSDWSLKELSNAQVNYAMIDGVVTYLLAELWLGRLTPEQKEAVWIFQEAVPATVECEDTGMNLDVEHHMKNIATWEKKREIALKRVRKWSPHSKLKNPASNVQVSNFIKTQLGEAGVRGWPTTDKKGDLKLSRDIIGPIAAKSSYPFSRWLNAMMLLRYYNKYLSTYGDTLLTKQHLEGKISYRLNIAQAATGRYSSSSINIQNIPRAPWVRKAFLPPDNYEHLVVADYSGIEVRVLAELSGDERLLHDTVYGNVHATSASAIYHITYDAFMSVLNDETHHLHTTYKEMRAKSKGFSFQLIYGAMAAALSLVLNCSIEEAEDAIRKWAELYPKAYNYRFVQFETMTKYGYLPICDGRTVYVPKQDRTVPVASNYGIQGAAASVMYRAMHHVKRLRDKRVGKFHVAMCATVHDEIVLAARCDLYVPPAKKILADGMRLGWLDIFPDTDTHNLIECGSGPSWGEAK